jgi:predicted nucleotidyltransferase
MKILNLTCKRTNCYLLEASCGWGFTSKDSDYDVRFIYVHAIDWYLNVFRGEDIIEISVDEVLDINGWDLRKALQLMYKSNPPLLEWLSSPIYKASYYGY